MRNWKNHPLFSLINGYLVDSPKCSNTNYLWNFVSLLVFCLIIEIVTSIILAINYNTSVLEAFNLVIYIIKYIDSRLLIYFISCNLFSMLLVAAYLWGDTPPSPFKEGYALLSNCVHGMAVASCVVCSVLASHFSAISNCTHNWNKLNYDHHMVKNGLCDLAGSGGPSGSGAWDSFHYAVQNMGDIAYHCSHCHAICCAGCIG